MIISTQASKRFLAWRTIKLSKNAWIYRETTASQAVYGSITKTHFSAQATAATQCRNTANPKRFGFSRRLYCQSAKKVDYQDFCVKTPKFATAEQNGKNCFKPSKECRKSGFLLRMEIFNSTYMRPRYSPCQAARS